MEEQALVEIIERRLLDDRRTQFRGTARVRFENLEFGRLSPREPNEKAVTYLEDKFKRQGIYRLEPKHRIPAVIDAQLLEATIEASPDLSLESLLENPKDEPPELSLPSNRKIECLQGLHRVEAGKRILPLNSWWWTVDLYVNDGISNAPDQWSC
jgi:hypothetical protein